MVAGLVKLHALLLFGVRWQTYWLVGPASQQIASSIDLFGVGAPARFDSTPDLHPQYASGNDSLE